ncbi:MAG TPA: cobalamin B12-binding domain-containing protein [Thermoplasmata archaeon]|nr:cobalamin B12-binding domain-containing protein [Thermoplasmata archaeon]
MKVLGAAIGNDVHTGGVVNFLHLAEEHGYTATFLGPAVPVPRVLETIRAEAPDLVAISYRLTAENARAVLDAFREGVDREGLRPGRRFVFGGTPPCAAVASTIGLFDAVFDGGQPVEEIVAWLRGEVAARGEVAHAHTLLERIAQRYPWPLIRHHFGVPSVDETVRGARRIAKARVLDVLSIAPDQNAQEFFFRPEAMRSDLDGAGGVMVRAPEDLRRIRKATRTGNYPLLRCYSGTTDLVKWAAMLRDTIDIAWGAVPLFWYSQLDGRSKRPLEVSIAENCEAMGWYASKGIPVEVNESHHWSLRDSSDGVAVAAAFLAAYNAKKAGVRDYVAQYMFNNPRGTSPANDLAKMSAKIELVEGLQDGTFRTFREARSGLNSLPLDMDQAKGHMGSSIHTMIAIRPHIVHVVGYTEATRHVGPKELIESCRIAQGAIRNALLGVPDPMKDDAVRTRRAELLEEAHVLLDRIRAIAPDDAEDPWADPGTLAKAVRLGVLDAPHLLGNPVACGKTVTRIVHGASRAVDPATGDAMGERERLKWLGAA